MHCQYGQLQQGPCFSQACHIGSSDICHGGRHRVHAPGLQLATGGAYAEIFVAYGAMICVHVLSVVLIHSLSVALSMFVSPYFQIMTPAAQDDAYHTEFRHLCRVGAASQQQ